MIFIKLIKIRLKIIKIIYFFKEIKLKVKYKIT